MLAGRIAEYLGVNLGLVEISRFPDGEIKVQFHENIRGKDVFIVQSICSPPNENLMELLIMIDAAKRASADRITAVLPFYGYARQDRKDQPRVPITAKLVANLLVAAGVDRILGMDFHAQQIQGFFDIPVDHLYAIPVMARYIKTKKIIKPVIVSPDSGGVKMAIGYAEMLGAGIALGAKYRKGVSEVEVMNIVGEVKGRTAIMVDDITLTGGTLCSASKVLKAQGAKDVYAVVTHGMLTEEACRRFEGSAIDELIITDSIPLKYTGRFPVTVLTVANLLGEAIKRIHGNESVTSLFKLS